MVEIPQNEFKISDLVEWEKLAKDLTKIKAKEILLRKKIFNAVFPNPKEGTNNYQLPSDYLLKGIYPIARDVDIGAFEALKEQFIEQGISPDKIVAFKPSLAKTEYNKLTAEERNLVDQCLIIKPGTPSLSIDLPKKGKAK